MNLQITLADLRAKSLYMPTGFYEQCLRAGTVKDDVLTITVGAYDQAKPRPLITPKTITQPQHRSGCCGKMKR